MKLFLLILITHWIADFVLQSDWQAKNKSKRWDALLAHTGIYSLVWFIVMAYYHSEDPSIGLYFAIITMIAHTATDYITSRINSKLWADGKVHYFFVSIGFDQILHYIQLAVTYHYLYEGGWV